MHKSILYAEGFTVPPVGYSYPLPCSEFLFSEMISLQDQASGALFAAHKADARTSDKKSRNDPDALPDCMPDRTKPFKGLNSMFSKIGNISRYYLQLQQICVVLGKFSFCRQNRDASKKKPVLYKTGFF